MNRFNNTIEFKHAGDSRLFNHYSKLFDKNVVEEFRRINDSDNSWEGHKVFISKIKAYVQENVKYDSKEDYANLVDTLKLLAENDV
jgi:hypothetical protein